ncbi:MAG: DUF2339 domain-containing protein [Hyphomonadaceae bacterium]|nr:DUF2339 domain-containing protein [Hyphomonadaceae bacterium]
MELFLLAGAALVAFGVVAAPIVLWVSFRRTIQLRSALIEAAERIDRLENALASARTGAPLAFPPSNVPEPDQRPALAPPRPEAPPETLPAPQPEPRPNFRSPASPPEAAPPRPASEAPFTITPSLAALLVGGVAVGVFIAALSEQLSGAAAAVVALIASSAALALAEWLRRARPRARRTFLCGLTIFGLAAAMASLGFASIRFNALDPDMAFLICAAGVVGALLLSELYGAPMLLFGLLAGATLPIVLGPGAEGALPRHAFLLALAAMAVSLARRRAEPLWAWIGTAAALAWSLVAVAEADAPLEVGAAAAAFAALAGLALAYAWEHARAPLRHFGGDHPAPTEPLILGSTVCLAGALLTAGLAVRAGPDAIWAIPFLLILVAGASLTAAWAEGLAAAALLAAALAAALLAVWPNPLHEPGLLICALILTLVSIAAGWWMLTRARHAAPGALLAALLPLAALICAEARLITFEAAELWIGAALLLLGLNLVLFARTSKTEASSPFAAGALVAACAALGFLAPDAWRAPALALALPALALLDRRAHQRSLRLAAAGLAAFVLWRLAAPLISGVQPIDAALAPGANTLALSVAASAVLFLIASHLFRGEAEHLESRATRTLFAAGLLLLGTAASIGAHHAFNPFAFHVLIASVGEMGCHLLAWTLAAAALAWRFGPRPGALLASTETAMFAGVSVAAIGLGFVWLNPWWGLAPAPAYGLAFGYAAPACAFALSAWLAALQTKPIRAWLAATLSLALFTAFATLQVRANFHPADLPHAPIAPAEGWTLTIVWVVIAATLAIAFESSSRRILSVLARAIAVAALIKSAFFDLADLGGFARFAAIAGVGLACIGILLLRNRFWASFLGPMPDPNLTPPR